MHRAKIHARSCVRIDAGHGVVAVATVSSLAFRHARHATHQANGPMRLQQAVVLRDFDRVVFKRGFVRGHVVAVPALGGHQAHHHRPVFVESGLADVAAVAPAVDHDAAQPRQCLRDREKHLQLLVVGHVLELDQERDAHPQVVCDRSRCDA